MCGCLCAVCIVSDSVYVCLYVCVCVRVSVCCVSANMFGMLCVCVCVFVCGGVFVCCMHCV